MLHYTELLQETLCELNPAIVETAKGKKDKIQYLNIESAFDIETTSEYQQGEKVAHMYIWMFGIGMNQPVYYGRKWDELAELVATLQDA
ncbi:hypothetical protein, partial [Kocuria arenosa]|uniref:hypothetical protein n=1 Tax=Kocuria arenosa TaxID=3071446 RepID=UPI0034D698E5